MNKPTILIAEDDFVIREGYLEPLLAPFFTIVSSVGNGLEALADSETFRPQVVLLDVALPGLRGFDVARRILTNQPDCKVVFVSNYAEPAYVQAARELGASGYVLKSRVVRDLVSAVYSALAGNFHQPVS